MIAILKKLILQETENLYMTAYVSKVIIKDNKDPMESTDLAEKIREKYTKNNLKNGITGVLYYGNLTFFQYIEGPKNVVIKTLKRIKANPHHENLTVISAKHIPKREFDNCYMKFIHNKYYINNLVDQISSYGFKHGKLKGKNTVLLENLLKIL